MFDRLQINMKRVYPTLVLATMSSGKSTLINALIGKEILPSSNRACTAKTLAILDNDRRDDFIAHTILKDGKYKKLKSVDPEAVASFNDENDVAEMILEGQIKGVKNSKKSMLIIDTPGINNTMNERHAEITNEIIDEYDEGLILYIINAEQSSTYDNDNFLTRVSEKLEKYPNFNIIFIVNKADSIDPEMESLHELLKNCKSEIEKKGIENPTIVPVSAGAALLFKKALNNEAMTKKQQLSFRSYYDIFKNNNSYSLVNYAIDPYRGDPEELHDVGGKKYTRASLYSALCNTGITHLETLIDETLVRSLKMKSPRITAKPKETGQDAGTNKGAAAPLPWFLKNKTKNN